MDDYHIPFIDEIFGFNQNNEEDLDPEEIKQMQQKQRESQHNYIRRRLNEEHDDNDMMTCNNHNITSSYDTDYKYMFKPFENCNISNINNTQLIVTEDKTKINITDSPILYSPNCEFMLVLNSINSQLQIIAAQQTYPVWSSSNTITIQTINFQSFLIQDMVIYL